MLDRPFTRLSPLDWLGIRLPTPPGAQFGLRGQYPRTPMQELRNYLASLPTGPIAAPSHLKRLLASCWNDFEGSHQENMKADKLGNRQMEEVEWEPPILSFTIERYRVTLLGSAQTERHRWEVNVGTKEAICYNPGFRRIKPRHPPSCNHDSLIQPINTRFHPVIDRIKGMLLVALFYKQIERAVKLHP